MTNWISFKHSSLINANTCRTKVKEVVKKFFNVKLTAIVKSNIIGTAIKGQKFTQILH
jgi:hypothetical protein